MRPRVVLIALVAAAALTATAPAHAAVQPYGTNDAGGFRNVLPPGEAGTDNLVQLLAFQGDSTAYPPHFTDQLPLYTDLLYASPTLTHDDIAKYFKDATFGVKPDEVESTESPKPGVSKASAVNRSAKISSGWRSTFAEHGEACSSATAGPSPAR